MGDAGLSKHSSSLPHNTHLALSPRHISNITVDYRIFSPQSAQKVGKGKRIWVGQCTPAITTDWKAEAGVQAQHGLHKKSDLKIKIKMVEKIAQ